MNIKTGVAKTAQQIAQQTARQIAQEPIEVVKAAGKQVSGVESTLSIASPATVDKPTQVSQEEIKNLNEKDQTQSKMMYENLQNEIQLIAQQKKDKEEQEKALSQAQKTEADQAPKALVEVGTKPSRNPLRGMGKKLSDLKKRAEIRMPPSG